MRLDSQLASFCLLHEDIGQKGKSGTPLDIEDQAKLQTLQIWAPRPDARTHTRKQLDSTPFICTSCSPPRHDIVHIPIPSSKQKEP